ncbi:hypothetical protein BDV95DRAFT_117282 [Massariosphaeria phaeospora]|uniref:Uncharacterized protein n=1 Tax=Massariosphaeria phaeospora TaxID=100035 RepID=A0A7C8MB10_9PLEO|nr:hypothetical protein BDV95DRAFT_117282 [Massariosphaeria phaeospora]
MMSRNIRRREDSSVSHNQRCLESCIHILPPKPRRASQTNTMLDEFCSVLLTSIQATFFFFCLTTGSGSMIPRSKLAMLPNASEPKPELIPIANPGARSRPSGWSKIVDGSNSPIFPKSGVKLLLGMFITMSRPKGASDWLKAGSWFGVDLLEDEYVSLEPVLRPGLWDAWSSSSVSIKTSTNESLESMWHPFSSR